MVVSGGYEVLRGGQGFSTRTLQKGDIVLKKVNGETSGGISGGGVYDSKTNTYTAPSGQKFSINPQTGKVLAQQGKGVTSSGYSQNVKDQIAEAMARAKRQEETTTIKEIAPTKIEPIKSVDYVDKSGKSVGGVTIQGSKGGNAKVLSSDFSKEQTKAIVKERGYSKIEEKETLKSPKTFQQYGQENYQSVLGENRNNKNNLKYSGFSIGNVFGNGLLSGGGISRMRSDSSSNRGNLGGGFSYSGVSNNVVSPFSNLVLGASYLKHMGNKAFDFISEKTQTLPEGKYNKAEKEFGLKWSNYISEKNEFIGTKEQYKNYLVEYEQKEQLREKSKSSSFKEGAEYLFYSTLNKFNPKESKKRQEDFNKNYEEYMRKQTQEKKAFKDLPLFSISEKSKLWNPNAKVDIKGGLTATALAFAPSVPQIISGGKIIYSTLPAGIQFAGKIGGYVLDASAIYSGGKTTLNKDLMPSQRITGGAFAGLGFLSLGTKAYRGASNLLGYPKQNTNILGFSQAKEGNKVVTDIIYKTDVKNLIGSKTYYGISRGASIIGKSDDVQIAFTLTGGAYTKYKGIDLITREPKFSKINKFVSGGFSFSEKADVVFDAGNILYSVEGLEGFTQINFGKSASKGVQNYYLGAGGGVKKGKLTGIFGASATKKGGGSFTGLIIQKQDDVSSGVKFIQGGGKKSSNAFFDQLYGNVAQASESNIVHQIPVRSVPKLSQGILPLISAKSDLVKQNYPSSVGETEALKLDKIKIQDQGLYPLIDVSQQTRMRSISRSNSRSIQSPINVQIPIQIPKQIQLPKSNQDIKIIQRAKQLTPSPSPITNLPAPYIPNSRIFIPSFDLGLIDSRLGKKRIKVKKIRGYTPSYTAFVFKIRGKAPKGVETGLRIRPITSEFSFTNLFSKKKVKVKKIKRRSKN